MSCGPSDGREKPWPWKESHQVFPEDRRIFEQALASELHPVPMQNMLYLLSEIISRHTGQKVIILIDEYDTPMLSAWTCGRGLYSTRS